MKEKLIDKMLSWSESKLAQYTNNAKLPLLGDRSNFIQEYADDGLYVYNPTHVNFYSNDSSILSLDRIYSPQDREVYHTLYNASLDSDQKMYRLVDDCSVDIEGETYGYLHFVNPTGRIGTPWLAHKNMDTEYVMGYIKHVEFFITTLKQHGYLYPSDALNMTKRVLDDETGLYYFCPNLGPNNFTFTRSCREFIEDQIHRLIYHRQAFIVAFKDYNLEKVDWKKVKHESIERWWVHRNK